jgi:hypothetical protein
MLYFILTLFIGGIKTIENENNLANKSRNFIPKYKRITKVDR